MYMESLAGLIKVGKPFLAVILLQLGYAGLSIISKFALNLGMNQHVLVVYRHALATIVLAPFAIVFERKTRPKMTLSVFAKIMLLGLLEPVIDQNLFYTGMKYTTATFTSALCNILPAWTFLMAWLFRFEKVDIRKLHSWAKIVGTLISVGGALLMSLVKGALVDFPWTKEQSLHQSSTLAIEQHPIKGALMITTGCFCWSCFVILQATTVKTYPSQLSLATLICMMGSVEGAVVALAIERGNLAVWSIRFDAALFSALYGGIICSGLAYYISGVVMKEKGPVFVTAFTPLSMVFVAIMGSFILAEQLYLGGLIGALVIVVGLYIVLWGKSKDQQPPSKPDHCNKTAPTSQLQSADTSNPEFIHPNVTKVTPTDEYV